MTNSIGDLLMKLERDIKEYGWSTISVFPDHEEDPPTPPFSYSVGFQEHDHPEIVVMGLHPNVAHDIIRSFYTRIAEGESFSNDERVEDIIENYEVLLKAVPGDGRPLNMARRYYGTEEIPALQVLWPDEEGNFPGEDGCDSRFEKVQDIELVVD